MEENCKSLLIEKAAWPILQKKNRNIGKIENQENSKIITMGL